MNSTFRVGRLAGIDVGVNWTWFAIFGLIVWTLSQNIFPSENPGLGENTYLAMGAAAALVFFASLLAHELGHAIQARRDGMEIEGITLWLLGGVAKFKGQFPSAGAEFRIALAGPLVSLALGVIFILIGLTPLPQTIDAVVSWLGYINIALLVFNLVPALPLDGGRLLRSTLWHFKRNYSSATRLAAGIGRLFGYALIAGGIGLTILQGSLQGVWLAFIGWFLLQGSGAEAQYAANTRSLDGLTFRDLMTPSPTTVDSNMTLGRFMSEFTTTQRHATYPVVDGGTPLGLLIPRAIAQIPQSLWDRRTVRECMLPIDRVPVFEADAPATDALAGLTETNVSRGLVLDRGELVGLVSINDLVRTLNRGRKPAPFWRRRR